MTLSLAPTQSDALTALRTFLLAVLPTGVEVVQGQGNRVPEPQVADFVVFTPVHRERIETNVDSFTDLAWKGSITAGVLTVTEVLAGAVQAGAKPSANASLAASTTVGAQISGETGGIGTYHIAPSQTVAGGTIFQAGGGQYMQATKLCVQIDVHGPKSADNAQTISTMFRDDYAVSFFEDLGPAAVPLYADDPRQLPFMNDQQQVENRWVIEAFLQTNQTVTAPQQFADRVDLGVINVDVEYPPA